jgi:dolichyl-phosphate beta-glucosyltransferase
VTLSVVVPAYHESAVFYERMCHLDLYLSSLGIRYELIIVDDSADATRRVVGSQLPSSVRLLVNPKNRGKGYSICRGMLEAKGNIRIFMDSDLAYDIRSIPQALAAIQSGHFHFVAGDRTHPNSRIPEPFDPQRKLISVAYRKILNALIIGGIFDSQCGFKAFSGALASELFKLLRVERFAFDVEIFYLVLKAKLPFKLIPISLAPTSGSSVRPFRDGLRAAWDAANLPISWYLKRYNLSTLTALAEPLAFGVGFGKSDDAPMKTALREKLMILNAIACPYR